MLQALGYGFLDKDGNQVPFGAKGLKVLEEITDTYVLPELKECSFRIACDRNFVRQGEQRQADFIDIVAWRSQAEFVSKYFQKGSLIAIEGSLQTRQYQDKNGNNRTAVEVVANNISFAGPKSSNQGGGASYQNSAPAYQNAAPARPAAVEAAPSYSAGSADDFAVIDDSDDLPF